MEVMRFERPFGPVKSIVGVNPFMFGSVKTSRRITYGDTRRRGIPSGIQHAQLQPPCLAKMLPLADFQLSLRAARNSLQPKLRLSAAVRNKRQLLSIRRPPHIRFIPA